MAFLPLVITMPFPPIAFGVYMLVSFFAVVQLYRKLDEKTRKALLYLPLVFAGLSFIKGKRPRIGMALVMVAMFCIGVMIADNMFLKNKIFKNETEKNLFRFQILILLASALYMFTSLVPLANLARNVSK